MTRAPSRRVGLTQVFTRPGYRRLWSARTVSQWGDVFATVARALLVFDLTGSPLGVSAVVVAEIVPVLLLAPFAGTLVDRLPRVTVMIAADLWRAVLAAALMLAGQHLIAVYAVAVGLSAGAVLFNPAASSALPALVKDNELVAANRGIWTAAVLSQIVLAPIAGILYAGFGAGPAFAINAASFLFSAALLAGLRLPAPYPPTKRRGFFADAAAGVRLLLADRLLRALGAGQLLAALSAGAISALLVVLARDRLALAPSGYGLLLGAIGVGVALAACRARAVPADPAGQRPATAGVRVRPVRPTRPGGPLPGIVHRPPAGPGRPRRLRPGHLQRSRDLQLPATGPHPGTGPRPDLRQLRRVVAAG